MAFRAMADRSNFYLETEMIFEVLFFMLRKLKLISVFINNDCCITQTRQKIAITFKLIQQAVLDC